MTGSDIDILILNTAVIDVRRPDFGFVDDLVGAGGLAKCETVDMPDYSPAEMQAWIDAGSAVVGGPGNTAPLLARAGLKAAVGVNLGVGSAGGLDVPGRMFHDVLTANGVDMSATVIHPTLPTGITLIHDVPEGERGGMAYFPNANNDFDCDAFKLHVERLSPKVVYYMYSGLSARGDANGGRDLAEFIKWCRRQGCITIVDSHTLCANPEKMIAEGTAVPEYHLLEPLLPELDIFFTSWDEARMIRATLDKPQPAGIDREQAIPEFLEWCTGRFCTQARPQLFGVTVKDGAFSALQGSVESASPQRCRSRFMCGNVVDFVGAGDSFRAGMIGYVARNATAFLEGKLNVEEAIQMGNLMATLYIKAPLGDRYTYIRDYAELLHVVRQSDDYRTDAAVTAALNQAQEMTA